MHFCLKHDTGIRLFAAVSIILSALFIKLFLFELVIVDGKSMQPSLYSGQILFAEKLSAHYGIVRRGQIVVARFPDMGGDIIKRVVGIPGDMIEIRESILYVNGNATEEPYIDLPMEYTLDRQIVPEGSCFVLGDNRNDSIDSHLIGPIPLETIESHAVAVIWPLKDINFKLDFREG